jgi:diguanylate cyclase
MKSKRSVPFMLSMIIYFIIYLTSTIVQSQFWGDILAPIGGLLSSGIILCAYLETNQPKKIKKIWAFFGLACFSWALADILWAVFDLVFHQNPENSDLISLLYMGTTVFLCAGIFIHSVQVFRKWNAIQCVVDSFGISASILFFIWIMYFNKNMSSFDLISKGGGWITVSSVILDAAALISLAIWRVSIRDGKNPIFINVLDVSLILFFIVDFYWTYQYIDKRYIPNSLIDSFYMAALLGVSAAAMIKAAYIDDANFKEQECSNVGITIRGLFILLCPALTIMLKGFSLNDLLTFLFIIFIYEVLTVYIQASIRNQQILKKECDLNLELEGRIDRRTKELVEKNRQLDFLSNQDTVTNLYNRRFFIYAMEAELKIIAPNEMLALIFIDLDRFKTINDTYGHDVGDHVLVEVSKRLHDLNRKHAFLARLGGDEFVLAFLGDYHYEDMEQIAQQMIDGCGQVIAVGHYSFHLTISVGISIYPLDATDANMLLRNADMAMYEAKKQGYNRYVSFNQTINDTIQRKNQIEILLKKAIFENEFMLFYQPQFSIPDKKLIGMEALLRWNSGEKGFIPPGEFIPIAEETDAIIPIGDWVMKKAICQIEKWNREYGLELKISINVSPKQLDQTGFVDELHSFMKEYSVKPDWVDIEITEGVAMEGKYRMSEIARQFKDAGVWISIDDFGTGYSSLSSLKMFPFDRIKIDKSLIDAITTDDYDLNITRFTVLLAKSMGIKTIAEGVESQEQLNLLMDLGCEQIQGYYLGKPVSPMEFERLFLKESEPLSVG